MDLQAAAAAAESEQMEYELGKLATDRMQALRVLVERRRQFQQGSALGTVGLSSTLVNSRIIDFSKWPVINDRKWCKGIKGCLFSCERGNEAGVLPCSITF